MAVFDVAGRGRRGSQLMSRILPSQGAAGPQRIISGAARRLRVTAIARFASRLTVGTGCPVPPPPPPPAAAGPATGAALGAAVASAGFGRRIDITGDQHLTEGHGAVVGALLGRRLPQREHAADRAAG